MKTKSVYVQYGNLQTSTMSQEVFANIVLKSEREET